MTRYLFNRIIACYIPAILLSLAVLTASCTKISSVNQRILTADQVGRSNNFTKSLIKGGNFWLTTYQRLTDPSLPYVFYIEGDGLAFTSSHQASDNPTPNSPMLLKLAALDGRANIVYIARPCQYTPPAINPQCHQSYWTSHRMSDEVVTSINAVIESLRNKQPFSLVGFSGGGGIAVLIAARNKQVKDIVTLAANLDHLSFNQHHNARPMLGSLNPIDYAPALSSIPQLHISGGQDKVVPPFIADKYVRASNSACVRQIIFNRADHYKNWQGLWRDILAVPLSRHKN